MSPSPGYNPSTVDYLSGNWTTSDPRKIAGNIQKINAQAAQAGQENANAAQSFLNPIEQTLAQGGGGYSADEASQIRMTPEQQADIVNRAGTTAGAATAAGVDAATRAANAAGGNPAAVAAYRGRAAQQEGAQAADAMTNARIGASNAAAQRAENIGQTRIGQQNVGLGLQQQYQQQQNQNEQNAQNRQVQGSQIGLQASQTPSTFDKVMGGIGGALSFLDEGGGGGNAVVAENGPEAVVRLEPKLSEGQRRMYGQEIGAHTARASSQVQNADHVLAPPQREAAIRAKTFLEQSASAKDPVTASQLAQKADLTSRELGPGKSDPVLDKLRDINRPSGPPSYKEEGGGSGEADEPEGSDIPSSSTQQGDDAATSQPWYKRFMSSIQPQPPTGQAPGAPSQMRANGPTPQSPQMQSARTLGAGIGKVASLFLEDGWTGREPGRWDGTSDGTVNSVAKFMEEGSPMEAADGAIFTKPTEIKMAPNEAAVPLGYRARAKARPSMAMPLVNEIQSRRMYGAR